MDCSSSLSYGTSVVILFQSKSPIPNMKSVMNSGRAGDDDADKLDKGNTSDASSEAF